MRPTLDQYLMELARVAAARTTCIRKGVGCVLADAKGRVLAIAYNGVASGQPHCNEPDPASMFRNYDPHDLVAECVPEHWPHACEGAMRPFGEPTSCEAVHAEQNAIVQCRDPDLIATAYVTTAPCRPCMKLLLNTGCQRIVYLEDHAESEAAARVWTSAGRVWEKV